ncbi:MAG: ABC transporter ATP-binding protein [Nocardioides sp.]
MRPLLELRDVRLRYAESLPGHGEKPQKDGVLAGIELSIDEGEFIVLCGPTGSGKSSLLGVVSGLVPNFTGGTLSGDVRLDGESVIAMPARERVPSIGTVGQNPAAGFVTDTVEEELAYGMEQLGLPAPAMRRRVEETLDLLGIAELRARDLRTLSGGQQQRVAIGSVLTMHPRLLVLDEPTSALDPTAAEDVLATLTRLVHDLGLSVFLAEHRLERVVPFADRVCVLRGDGSLDSGRPDAVLLTAPLVPPIVELGRIAGWRPLPLSVRAARRMAGSLVIDDKSAIGDDVAERTSAPSIEIRRLSVTYGHASALSEVSIDAAAGDVTAVMGRNGSGKSTLLWAIHGGGHRRPGVSSAGAPRRVLGQVRVYDEDPCSWRPERRRGEVGLVPQNAADLLYLDSVTEECAANDRGAGLDAGATRRLLDSLASGIADHEHPRDLSEGQRLALVLAIVLASGPRVVLLDEPTRGLDNPSKARLSETLGGLAADGHTVLVATHDVEFAAMAATRVWVMADGEIVSSGPARRVLAESPAFAPQISKILGPPWLRFDEVVVALAPAAS